MNNRKYRQEVEREIDKLNLVIDRKIISGLNYAEDARRHKKLLAEIRRAKSGRSFWSMPFASLKYISMFLF